MTLKNADLHSDPQKPDVLPRFQRLWLNGLFYTVWYLPWIARFLTPLAVLVAWLSSKPTRVSLMSGAGEILGPHQGKWARVVLSLQMFHGSYCRVLRMGMALRREASVTISRTKIVAGESHLKDACASGCGVIVLTAHVGPCELAACSLSQMDRNVYVVLHRDKLGAFERLRSSLFAHFNLHTLPVEEGMTMWMHARDALLSGDILLMQGDRVMQGQPDSTNNVMRLGDRVVVASGSIRLAGLTGALIVPAFSSTAKKGGVSITVHPAIRVDPSCSIEDMRTIMIHLADLIEAHVRKVPRDWMPMQYQTRKTNNG